jgi:hypothetical protein
MGSGVKVTKESLREQWMEGRGGDWNSFAFFSDPDGNGLGRAGEPHTLVSILGACDGGGRQVPTNV